MRSKFVRRSASGERSPILERVRKCVEVGFGMGAVFSAWVALLALIQFSTTITTRNGTEVNVFAVMATYLLGGTAAGAVVGVLLPLTRWVVGAVVVGILAAVPVFFGVAVAGSGWPLTSEDMLVVVIVSVAFGGTAGVVFRHKFGVEKSAKKGQRSRRSRRQ